MKNRKVYLDILKIISVLFVIYHHTGDNGYLLFTLDCPAILRAIYIATAGMVEVAVPIFFMVSGALLINKEESLRDLYVKRVLRIIIVLVLFSILQYVYQVFTNNEVFSIKYFIKTIVTDNIIVSYWYLYAYLIYLVCLPIIRKLARAMSNSDFKYLFVVFLAIEGVLKGITFMLGWEMNMLLAVPFCNRIIIYPLLGYYMEERMERKDFNVSGIIKWLICMIITLIYIVTMTMVHKASEEELNSLSHGMIDTGFTILLVIGFYYIIKALVVRRNISDRATKVYGAISGTVFGVYLIERIIRELTMPLYDAIAGAIGHYLSAWIWVLCTFIIGAVIIYILKLIPLVKRIL